MGLGAAGGGALLVAFSLLVENDYWLLVTGTVFVLIGISLIVGKSLIN